MRNERERELGEPLTNRAGRPLARATSGCAGALGSSGGSVEADIVAASDRAAWCHAVQRAALNLGGGVCIYIAEAAVVRGREVPAEGKARSEVTGAARECAACAGVRAAWGQARSYGW